MNEINIIYRSKHPTVTGKEEEIISSHIHDKIPVSRLAKLYNCDRKPIQNIIKKNGYSLRPSTNPLLEGKEEQIIKMYVEDKLTIQSIRKKVGISYGALQNFLRRNDIELRNADESRRTEDGKIEGTPRKLLSSDDLNSAILLYENGHTLEELGKLYDISSVAIRLKLLKNGVTLRTADEAMSNPRIIEKIKNTCLEKFGCENPMQNPDIFHKSNANRYKNKTIIIDNIAFEYLQGFEPQGIKFLTEKDNLHASQIKIGKCVPTVSYYFNGKRKRYFPDLYIEHLNLLVEVKCRYTYENDLEKNIAKRQASIKKGYNHKTIIFSNNGKEIEEVLDFIS